MAAITEDYVSFETVKLLKEKGFDEKCRTYYKVFPESRIAAIYYSSENRGVSEDDPNEILCPTLQMAMKWLREVKGLYIDIITLSPLEFNFSIVVVTPERTYLDNACEGGECYLNHQDACEAAIKYCLEKFNLNNYGNN